MNSSEPRGIATTKYSLRHLLTLTALIAVSVAGGLAYRKNQLLTLHRDDLLAISSQLRITDFGELAMAAIPSISDDFETWQVYVPEGREYELILGIGQFCEKSIPPVIGSVGLPSGQHRVTLHTAESTVEQFRYTVYLDGREVIEKTMGSQWMPQGWGISSSGLSWPSRTKPSSMPPTAPLQLAAQTYVANVDFGPSQYHIGQNDKYVTQLGYRLWIDQPNQDYGPASPFLGFPNDPQYLGIGLRDGLRYKTFAFTHQWSFIRPQLAADKELLQIEAEFTTNDGTIISSSNQSFQSWEIRNTATGAQQVQWIEDSSQTTHSVFLQARSSTQVSALPVVEVMWDANRPDEVGLRLADCPANAQIKRWRIRILEGRNHLWRELKVNDRPSITPEQVNIADATTDLNTSDRLSKAGYIDLDRDSQGDLQVLWRTNEPLPLQFLESKDQRYSSMGLYQGIPVKLGIRIPNILKPTLAAEVSSQLLTSPDTAIPGGPVFSALQMDFEANFNEWIWISAQRKE